MLINRRDFVRQGALASAAVTVLGPAQPLTQEQPAPGAAQADRLPMRVGMTDWNLGQRGDITKIALAREIGLDGIQVSVQYPTDGKTPTLRDPATQAAFHRAALDNGIQICSLAIGNPGKSRLPMHTNPAFGILLVEAVEIAHNLGTNNILLPILGDSHIDMTNQGAGRLLRRDDEGSGALRGEVRSGGRPRGLDLGGGQHQALDAIGSDHVAVYYDAHNIVPRVKDIYVEPKMLGKRIHQIHVKNANMLMSTAGGKLDWPRMAQEFQDIGYRGWYVLETGSPTKDIVADTRANLAYVRQHFKMPGG